MGRNILTVLLLFLLGYGSMGQNVINVQCYQEGKKAVVTYHLDKAADVSLSVSIDGGVTFSEALEHVSGDVGNNVQPGNNKIVWDILAEREQLYCENTVFKVFVSNGKSISVNGVTFNMVYVSGGTFTMGDTWGDGGSGEKPTHSVTLSDYYIGKYEVTQGLWEAVMGSNPSYFKNGSNYPVETVSWDDCDKFIKKLNSLTGLTFRLPTEAEWEYAARGGNHNEGTKYSGSGSIGNVAWYEGNIDYSTHPVGQKSPNALGLYDMSGNVWEWCSDRYGRYRRSSQTNPKGPSKGSDRVLRGGSWSFDATYCRVAYRINRNPSSCSLDNGFRLVLLP